MGGEKSSYSAKKGKPEYFNILPNSSPEPLIHEVASKSVQTTIRCFFIYHHTTNINLVNVARENVEIQSSLFSVEPRA